MGKKTDPTQMWRIICPEYSGAMKRALHIVYDAISARLDYTPSVERNFGETNCNLAIVGTYDNEIIKKVLDEEIKEGEYLVKVKPSPFDGEKKIAIISGFSPVDVMYAANDFADDYTVKAAETDRIPFFDKVFNGIAPDYCVKTSPFVKRRGLWTWGHCIYDYKKYFDNMARLKLNRVTIWNDFVPFNIDDILDYAHSLGIAVILGYSWGWTDHMKIDISDDSLLEKWQENILENYEKNYACLDIDGIYFQTFTETKDDNLNGINIAQKAVDFVNSTASKILDKYPNLEIQFGLHATSVKNQLDIIAKTDKRVSIIWEDCGDFPWEYLAFVDQNQEATEDFTKQIMSLRDNAPTGGVFKGQVCLDWWNFKNQTGRYIMGENMTKGKTKRDYAQRILHQNQSYWLKNADKLQSMVKLMGENADISDLLEEGLFEEGIWFAAALYAEVLWNPNRDINDIIRLVSERENIRFA